MLSEADLPVMFRAADEASKRGRTSTFRRAGGYLLLLVAASIGSAVAWESPGKRYDLGAAVATLALLGALVLSLATLARKPETQWYEGRAGAESVKSLSWLYCSGGDPFDHETLDADGLFLKRLAAIKEELRNLTWPASSGRQITDKMRALRTSDWPTRKDAYLRGRIDEQLEWYRDKARTKGRREGGLSAFAALITAVGLGAGVAKALRWIEVDILGVLAALAAAVAAWAQAQQHRTLAAAYGLAAQELALVLDDLGTVEDELEWPAAVNDAEEAISREHTMWLARRGQGLVL